MKSMFSVPTFDLRLEGQWVPLGILLVSGILDGLLAWLGGNRSTMSRIFLDLESHQPHVALLMAYSAAVLIWHLTVVSTLPVPELWWAILKGVIVVIPILAVFLEVALTPPESDGLLNQLAANRIGIITLVVIGTALGWTASWWGVSQHTGAV
jgi:hypothetical protein